MNLWKILLEMTRTGKKSNEHAQNQTELSRYSLCCCCCRVSIRECPMQLGAHSMYLRFKVPSFAATTNRPNSTWRRKSIKYIYRMIKCRQCFLLRPIESLEYPFLYTFITMTIIHFKTMNSALSKCAGNRMFLRMPCVMKKKILMEKTVEANATEMEIIYQKKCLGTLSLWVYTLTWIHQLNRIL